MRKNKDGWDYLLHNLKPDIALLQETGSSPENFEDNKVIHKLVKKNLNNSIYCESGDIEDLEILDRQKMGLISSMYLDETGKKIFLISVYGNLSFIGTLDFVLLETIQEFVECLRAEFKAKHILIAGDFNMDRRMDDNPTGTKFSKKGETRHNNFFDGILNLDFEDCLRKRLPEHVQTYRHNRGNYPWELDHMFATPELNKRLKLINVYLDDNILKLSDHNPIVADFD